MKNLFQEIVEQLPEGFLTKPCIVTFGSSTTSDDSPIGRAAQRIGSFLAENNFVNVNGGQSGTMRIVADLVTRKHGVVVGVKRQKSSTWNNIGHCIACSEDGAYPYELGMAIRKGIMLALGHGFIVFMDSNGGPGTGTELQTLIEMTMNTMADKRFYRPIAVVCERSNALNTCRKVAHYFGEKDLADREHTLLDWLEFKGYDEWLRIFSLDNTDQGVTRAFNHIRNFLTIHKVVRHHLDNAIR